MGFLAPAIEGLFLYQGGREYLKNMFTGGGTIPIFNPQAINTGNIINPQMRQRFKQLVDQGRTKRASGGSMSYKEIAEKFREKRAYFQKIAVGPRTTAMPWLKDIVRPAAQTLMYGLGAGLLGSKLYDRYQGRGLAQRTYKEMFERFPELNNIDRQTVDDYWRIMSQYAPAMTKNPLVAGQFIKNMADYGYKGIDFPTLKSLIDIEKVDRDLDLRPFEMISKGLGSGVD